MECVPFSIKDVNVYKLDPFNLSVTSCTEADCVYNLLSSRNPEEDHSINSTPDHSRYQTYFDLDTVVSTYANRVRDGIVSPQSNMLHWGAITHDIHNSIAEVFDENFSEACRVLFVTTSLICNFEKEEPSEGRGSILSGLWNFRSVAGSQVLHKLDLILCNVQLAKASHDKLKVIFVILLGAVFAVGFMRFDGRLTQVSVSTYP